MVQKDPQAWPPAIELEKWLMNTVKDADAGALFLRRMLHMNPAYGQYLASDEDLAGIVQLFAKRFRAKILASENPIQPATLYEPLCEVIWRVVGHVLHTIIDLQDQENLPVPKEASGQVKMLLQTNVELSRKLNEMRRAYLRELSMHRDKQRRISEKAERALRELQEDPVMFYEPLAYVLDEQTKAFVREVVEEKIKLEQSGGLRMKSESLDDVRHDADEIEHQLKNAQAEMRVLRSAAARDAEAAKRAKELEGQWREEAAQERRLAQARREECAGLELQLPALKGELAQLRQRLQAEQAKGNEPVEVEPVVLEDPQVGVLRSQLEKANAQAKSMQEKMEQLHQELNAKEQELRAGRQREEALEGAAREQEQAAADRAPAPVQDGRAQRLEEDLRAQAEKHMRVEKELRSANRALEKALEEEKARNTPSTRPMPAAISVETNEGTSRKAPKAEKSKANVDEQIAKAVQTVTAQFEKKIREQEREIEHLRKELEEQAAKAVGPPMVDSDTPTAVKEKRAKQVVVPEVEPVVTGSKKSKKCKDDREEELEERIEELEQENENLRQQVSMLHDKLKEVGGREAVMEVMERIKLTVPTHRKKRKKKAFERLYEDAQRRIIEMRMREQKMRELEQQELREAAKRVRNRRNLHQVEMLGHLQKAAEATRARFHDALANYHDRNRTAEDGAEADAEGASPDGGPEEEVEAEGRGRSGSPAPSASPGGARPPPWPPPGPRQGPPPGPREGRWTWDEDPAAVLGRLSQLKEENLELQSEVQRLRAALPGPGLGLQSRSIQGRGRPPGRAMSPPAAPVLGSAGPAARGRNASPTAGGRNASASPPPPAPGPSSGPTFGVLHKSRSQGFTTAGSSPHASAARGNLMAGPSMMAPVHQAQSSSPDLLSGFGSPGSTSTPEPAGNATASSFSPALTTQNAQWIQRTPSSQLTASMPLLGGAEPPWRRGGSPAEAAWAGAAEAAPPPPAAWGAGVSPVPPGQGPKGPGPDWVPHVIGRVPLTATPLEPIRKAPGAASPRSPGGEDAAGAAAALEGRLAAAPLLAPGPTAPGSAPGAGPGFEAGQPLDAAHARGSFKVSKTRKGSNASFIDETKPMTGFCVTPLRSQESLVSVNGGNPKWASHPPRWAG